MAVISIRSAIPLAPSFVERVRAQLAHHLGHDAGSIQRSTVRFEDVNGPKGGVDKLCRIKLVLTGRPTMLAEKRAATPGRAFASAVQSIRVAIARDHERQLGRRLASIRSRKRSPTNLRRKKATSM